MITELRAYNFKSWQDTDALQFAPLTGFFGANNSGKTSILQLLLLLKQTVENQPSDWNAPLYFGNDSSPVNLGNFDTVIHRHKQDLSLGISVSWESSIGADIDKYIRFHDLRLPSDVAIVPSSRVSRNPLEEISFSTSVARSTVNNFHYETDRYKLDVGLSTNQFRCYGLRSPLTQTMVLFSRLEEDFENLFSRIHHLGPLRRDPQYRYKWVSDHPEDVGQHGEKMISSLLSSRVRLFPIEEQILKWLQRLELIDSYDLNPTYGPQDYGFLVQQYKDGPKVRFTDVGFGVSQVLPVLTLCYYAPEGSILILEQPEAHLHPKAQSELADVLIDVVKNRNIQIILESHSEHLLLRLMRRIAEYGIEDEGISKDLTAFHFCEIDNGNSRAEQLKVDEYGNISNWPPDFFGDDMGDVAKKTKAEMKRRKANK